MNGERCEQGVLDSTVFLASELDLGEMPRQHVAVDDRVGACRPREVEASAASSIETSPGNTSVAHVEVGDRGGELVGIITSGETDEEPP